MEEAVNTDLTFFTNLPDSSLLDRFTSTLPQAQLFDVLVGYFRLSGFHQLHEHLEDVEKIRNVQEARPARQTTRKIKQKLEDLDSPSNNPVQILRILQNHIPDGLLEKEPPGSGRSDEPHEIILSSYRVSDTSSNPGDEG